MNPVQEKAGTTVTANLLTGLGIDEFYVRTDGVGSRALLTDALGSTVALGDSTGTLQTQYTYESFGSATTVGQTNASSYKYTGREDDGTGLYYYRARYYHPRLQRFIAEDPIGFLAGSANFYAYVSNSPIGSADALGLLENFIFPLNGQSQSTLQCSCGATYPAFSGAAGARNDPSQVNVPNVGAIPPGTYYIIDRQSGGHLGWLNRLLGIKTNWFSLYSDDGQIDDFASVGGVLRGQFRLHPGGNSAGCITLTNSNDFDRLRSLLLETQKAKIPGTNINYYGTVTVK